MVSEIGESNHRGQCQGLADEEDHIDSNLTEAVSESEPQRPVSRTGRWRGPHMDSNLTEAVTESSHRGQCQGLADEEDKPEAKKEARGLETWTPARHIQD
jgi:hypothetical protein